MLCSEGGWPGDATAMRCGKSGTTSQTAIDAEAEYSPRLERGDVVLAVNTIEDNTISMRSGPDGQLTEVFSQSREGASPLRTSQRPKRTYRLHRLDQPEPGAQLEGPCRGPRATSGTAASAICGRRGYARVVSGGAIKKAARSRGSTAPGDEEEADAAQSQSRRRFRVPNASIRDEHSRALGGKGKEDGRRVRRGSLAQFRRTSAYAALVNCHHTSRPDGEQTGRQRHVPRRRCSSLLLSHSPLRRRRRRRRGIWPCSGSWSAAIITAAAV